MIKLRSIPILMALFFSTCGLPSNTPTPPEVMVTGETGATGGISIATSIPFSGTSPSSLASLSIPSGFSLWGSTVVDNYLVLLAKDSSNAGYFMVAPVPLSSASSFAQVSGLSGTPYAMAQVTTQFLAVLESTPDHPDGCVELFEVNALLPLTGGGTISPKVSCQPIPGVSGALSGGFLLPLADGITLLAGTVSGSVTTLSLLTQTSVLSGTGLSVTSTWTLPVSYGGGVPITGAALSEAVLLPDPSSPSVDVYLVTTLYGGGGGTLSPSTTTKLQLSAAPTFLTVDPAQNFLLAGSSGEVSLFGLNSVLNPSGSLSPIGSTSSLSGQSFEAIASYSGSS